MSMHGQDMVLTFQECFDQLKPKLELIPKFKIPLPHPATQPPREQLLSDIYEFIWDISEFNNWAEPIKIECQRSNTKVQMQPKVEGQLSEVRGLS